MKKTIIFISLIVTSALILSACTKPVVSEEPVQTEQAPGIAPAGPAEGVPVNEEPVSKPASTADPSKYTAGSPEHYMATRGFDPEALRVYWDDYYEIND
ncbi:MAG: hypothetical protein HUJ75_04230, partial [Parasporobacterium sp.]|nr:hypothetical protein [Parasporobacterium sp.]